MTKARPPLSIENALHKVIGELSIEYAAEVTGRQAHYLRALTDPDKEREQLTVRDMIKLDLAHREAGLVGAPLFETVARILKAADAEIFSDAHQLAKIAARVIREGGDAHVALFSASRPGVTDKQLQSTLRELEESHAETATAIAAVSSILQNRHAQPP